MIICDQYSTLAKPILMKMIMIMIFVLQLLLVITTTAANPNVEYVNKSCTTTTLYPRLCCTSLSPYADAIQTDPKLLANASISVALSATQSSSTFLKWLAKRINPRDQAARSIIGDCVEEVVDSIQDLEQSLKEMSLDQVVGSSAFEYQMSNVQTWVSAALTDDDTCLDGLDQVKVSPQFKNLVRLHILKVAHFTSNALALINNYAKLSPSPP